MISKQQQKYIQSLHNKKHRQEYGLFLVEGEKGIVELLDSDYEVVEVFCTAQFQEQYRPKSKTTVCSTDHLQAISTFKSNTAGVAIVKQKRNTPPTNFGKVTLILDNINDPGNLGTIIRLADWYGLSNIICSQETVEFYNPKVISSTMGSFSRISPYYTDLSEYLKKLSFPIYGADLKGENVHQTKFDENIGLVIGSESHGISPTVHKLLSKTVTIPSYGQAESLNAAIATAIILDNILRGLEPS